jgi:hypothetical protein
VETDTPETDQKASPHIGFYSCATVPVELAKKLEKQRNDAIKKIERQAERIRYLEGATNHATGTPLSIAIKERDDALIQLTGLENERNEIKKVADELSEFASLHLNSILDKTTLWRDENNLKMANRIVETLKKWEHIK